MASERLNAIKKRLSEQYIPASTAEKASGKTSSGRSQQYEKIREKIKSGGFSTIMEADDVDHFFSDARSYLKQSVDDYNGLTWEQATSKEYQSNRRKTSEDLTNRASQVRTYLNANRATIAPEIYESNMKKLDEFSKLNGQRTSIWEKAYEMYGQFSTKEQYDEAIQVAQWQQKYDGMSLDELRNAADELDDGEEKKWLTNYATSQMTTLDYLGDILSIDHEISEMMVLRDEHDDNIDRMMELLPGSEEVQKLVDRNKEISQLYGDLDERIAELYVKKDKLVNDERYKTLQAKEDPEFSKYSQYAGSTWIDNGWDRFWAWDKTAKYKSGYEDIRYDFINDPDAVTNRLTNSTSNLDLNTLSWLQPYRKMTEDQVAVYNYYYAKHGKEFADNYLKGIQEKLNAQQATEVYGRLEGKTLLELAFGVAAGMEQFSSGVKSFLNYKDYYIPQSVTQITSAMVREDLADATIPIWYNFKNGQWADEFWYNFKTGKWEDQILGNPVGQVAYDGITTTSNMLPSILASSAANLIVPGSGAIIGSGLMGASASGNAYQEMLNLGYTKEQARSYSNLVGASEAGLQYLLGGIGKLGGKVSGDVTKKIVEGIDNALARAAIQFGGDILSEGIEESLQEVLTPWFKEMALHIDEDVNWSEVAYSGLMGCLTAFFMDGTGKVAKGTAQQYGNYRTGKTILNTDSGLANLKNLAYEVAGRSSSDMQDTLNKQIGKLDKKSTATRTGKLYNTVKTANNLANASANRADIAKSLMRNNFSSEKADAIAGALVARYNGQELTDAQNKLLRSVKNNSAVQNAVANIMSNTQSTMGQRSSNIRNFEENVDVENLARDTGISAQTIKQIVNGNVSPEANNTTQSSDAPLADNQAAQISTGRGITIQEIASVKNGDMTFLLDDGSVVPASEVNYGTEAEAVAYGVVEKLAGMIDEKTATRLAANLVRQINQGDPVSDQYIEAVAEAYRLGYEDKGINAARTKNSIASKLTDRQRNYAYKMGEKYAIEQKSTQQDNGTKPTDNVTKPADNETKPSDNKKKDTNSETNPSENSTDNTEGSQKTKHRKGKVASWGISLKQMKMSFNSTQKQAFDIIKMIAHVTGIDVVLYRSKADADGNFQGGMVDGIDMNGSQGAFSWHNGKIYVDINAGLKHKSQQNDLTMYSMLRTFSHEFVHFIEEYNPVEYEDFRDLVFDVMREKETDPDDLIDAYMMQHQDTTRDEASREVVAEAMTDILPQSRFVQQLAQKNRNLFQKLLDHLKEFIQKIKDHFAFIGETSAPEVAAVTEQIDGAVRYVEKIVEAFDRVAVQAVENYQEGTPMQKNTAKGGVQMQVKQDVQSGKYYVQADRQVLTGDDPKVWKRQIEQYINETIRKNEDVAIPTGDGHVLLLTARSAYKLSDNHVSSILKKIEAFLPDKDYALKGRAATHIDELIRVARFDKYGSDVDHKHENDIGEDGFNYFEAYFRDYDGKYYRVPFSAAINENMETVYSIGKIRQRRFPANRGSSPETGALNSGRKPSEDIIYSSFDKSQEAKSAIKIAYEKALAGKSQKNEQHQHRTTTLSNRMILEQATETVDQQNLPKDQRSALRVFQNHLDTLRELEAQKAEQQKVVQEAKKKGTESVEYKNAIRRRDALTTRIRQETTKLLELENTAVLRRVLVQAKNVILDEQAAIRKKALEDYRKARAESRERSEMLRKLRKDVKDIYKLYNRTKDANNVKEEMKEFAVNALSSAELLLNDLYEDDEMIRQGLGIKLSPHEKALLDKAKKILYRLDNPPEVSSVAQLDEWERREKKLKLELSKTKTELQEAFLQARRNQKGDIVAMVMQDMCDAYKKLANSKKAYIRNAFRPFVLMHLEGVRDNLKATRVEDMTLEQLTELHEAYTMVLTSIRDANKAFCASLSIEYMAKRLISEFGGERLSKSKIKNIARNISDAVGWEYEKLYYALERINSPIFTQLFTNLANSENIIMEDVADAIAYQREKVKKYGYNKWSVNKKVDREFVDNLGHQFQLTLGEIMLLYAYTRRGNVWKQLEIGGFVLERKSLTDDRNATAYKLKPDQCLSITNLLTEEQKHFVEDMQKYLSDVMGEKGNEVSMKLYGVKLFNDQNYCPIRIAEEYKARVEEAKMKDEAGFASLAHTGFTKVKNKDATATIYLDSFMDIWVDHVNEMSRYHGAVPALEDIRRVMNYSDYSDGQQDSKSVRAMMENKFGKKAVRYFEDLYREVNSGAVFDRLQSWSKKALSKSRKLAVAYKLSVLVQQVSSINRAFAIVDQKYFAGMGGAGASVWGVAKTLTNHWSKKQTAAYAEMVKYAPGVTLAKEIGGFDASGGGIRAYMMDTEKKFFQSMKTGTAGEKLQAVGKLIDDNPIANLPNLADKIAWIEIWNACKRETKDKHRRMDAGSDAFMNLVGQRFTEVIRATQVYDSVFAKSPLLKSKNVAVQYTVSFLNEANVTANMVESAIRDIIKGGGENIRKGARKLYAITSSIIFCNILKSLIYAMRDDDEEENYTEKYTQALVGNLLSDFTGFNYIPLARDIWSIYKGYDVERPDISIFSDLLESCMKYRKIRNQDISDMSPDELEEWDKRCTEAQLGMVGAIAGCFGIPIKNIYREIDSIFYWVGRSGEKAGKTTWNTFRDACYQGVVDALPFKDQESKSDKIYEAMTEGDTKYLDRLQAGYLNSDGKLKNSYYTALRKGLREHDPRIQDAANARKEMNTDEYLDIIEEIVAEGYFDEKDVVAAIRSEYNRLKEDDCEKLLFEAMSSGDQETAEKLKSNFVNDEGEFSESSYRSAIRKGLREYDPRILQAAEARLNKDHSTANKILNQIVKENCFSRSDIAAAITAEYDQMKDD